LERYYRTYKLSESPIYSRDELVPLIVQHLTELVSTLWGWGELVNKQCQQQPRPQVYLANGCDV